MKHPVRNWLLLVGLIFLLPCSALALSEWTILVQMASDDKDTSLEEANWRNVQDMATTGVPAGCQVVILEDKTERKGSVLNRLARWFGKKDEEYSGGTIYSIENREIKVDRKLGEVNTGSPYVLWDFLKVAVEKYPAKKYALILNGHGSGIFSWRGTGGVSDTQPGAVDFNPDRFVAYDTSDNDCLTVFELSAVLKAFQERLNQGRILDVVAFDACLPGSIEALYQFRSDAAVLVGSADTLPLSGFPYGRLLKAIAKRAPADALAMAAAFQDMGMTGLAYWRLDRIGPAVGAFNNLTMEVLAARQEGVEVPIRLGSTYSKDRYWELPVVLSSLIGAEVSGPRGPTIRQLAKEAKDSLDGCKAVPNGRSEISIAWPGVEDYKKFRAFYKALDFARDTRWDELIDRKYGLGN